MLEMTEVYEFSNGWALEVVTDLRRGIADASASARLLAVEEAWIFPNSIGSVVTGERVPPAPDPGKELFWFTEQGESPDWMTPDGLAMLCVEVASLPPRDKE